MHTYVKNISQKNGIWHVDAQSEISYPEAGNKLIYEVEDSSFWFKHRNRMILNVIKHFEPKGIIFDTGGGNGVVSKHLTKNGYPCVLIEPGEQGCLNAQKRGVENIVRASLQNLEFHKNSVPAVGIFDVLEHIEDDFDFLKQLQSILQKNGLIYFTVPAYNFLNSWEDKVAGHYRRYTIGKIKKLFLSTGFNLIFGGYFFSVLIIPVWLFRALPYQLFNIKNGNIEKQRNDLKRGAGISGKILEKIWAYEAKKLSKLETMPTGTSLIGVAQKF